MKVPRLLTVVILIGILLSSAGCGGAVKTPVISQETANSSAASGDSSSAESSSGQDASQQDAETTPPRPSPTPTPEPLPDELATISGRVILPEGSGLSLAGLKLLTNLGDVALDETGEFTVEIARNPVLPSLAMLVNDQGNPLLLASRRGDAVRELWDVSIDSTARALVLFDPSIWNLSDEQQANIEAALPDHSFYEFLKETLVSTIQSDPVEPLSGNLHADPFNLAAMITGELLQSELNSTLSHEKTYSKAHFSPAYKPRSKSNSFVWVEDDLDHNQPEVTLVNNTFCYYTATVYYSPEGGGEPQPWNNTKDDPLVLDKSKLYSIRPVPTGESNMGTERVVSPGDGNLRFVFTRDDRRTVWDIGWSLMGAIIGGMGKKVDPKDAATFAVLKETIEATYGDLMLLISAGKGKSSEALAEDVIGWFGKNSLKVALAYGQAMSSQWKDKASSEFIQKAGELLGHKFLSYALTGYAGSDMLFSIYSLANSPKELFEQGVQREGYYPAFRIFTLPEVIRLPDMTGMPVVMPNQAGELSKVSTETMVVWVEDVPEDITSFQIMIDYQDGTPPFVQSVSAVDRRASVEDIHTFISVPPGVKVAVLDYLTSQVLAEITVPVLVGSAASTKMYSLRFTYDDSSCPTWMCETGWTGCSRVNTNIPVMLMDNKVVINYTWENYEKHYSYYGFGTIKDGTLTLTLVSSAAVDKSCQQRGGSAMPCKLLETASVTVSGPFDTAISYEQELQASGSSEVDWPRTDLPPAKDNQHQCSVPVIKAYIMPGFKEYGR